MGRGKGGSASHGKRTPGGISTSSKMSKVGEIEAKHGVLGEEYNDIKLDDVKNLAGKKIAGQGGSNPGGVFLDKDGQKRYIKVYKNKGQAYSEAVANNIYNALGIKASKSTLFEPGSDKAAAGRGIANGYVEGEVLADYGNTPEISNKILDGVAADILVANWDAVGLVNDNIVIDEAGDPVRIDNGGSFAYRARGAEKPRETWKAISEWDVFSGNKSGTSSSTNSYSDVIKTAGYKGLDDIKPRIKEQVERINQLAQNTNDFEDLLPKLEGVDASERKRMLEMLRARRELLNKKVGLEPEELPKSAEGDKQAVAASKVSAVGNTKTFVENASAHGMSPEEWQAHLDGLATKMTAVDSSGNFVVDDKQFNAEMGNMVIENMKKQRSDGVRKGGVTFLPNKGKVFLLGDTHERYDNVLAIYDKIQSDPSTNLDSNPDNKIVLNGDAFSMSKEGQENGQIGARDSLRGEAMLRLLTYLMARHPDQVFMTNGNHEMGVLLALKSRQDPSWQSQRSSGNNFKDLPREQLGVSNIELLVNLIKNNGIAVAIGDKSKGETARLITHTAGERFEHVPAVEMAKEEDPMEWREKYYSVYNGWSDLEPVGLQRSTSETGSDKRYFGHVAPSVMKRFMDGGEAEATESRETPVGAYNGGGVFVDTQTGGAKSGYVEIDLDKDKDTVHTMKDVFANYSPGELHEALTRVANMPLSKATTDDNKNKKWL